MKYAVRFLTPGQMATRTAPIQKAKPGRSAIKSNVEPPPPEPANSTGRGIAEIVGLLQGHQSIGRMQRKQQREALQEQFRVAALLRDSPDLWLDFCALDWAGFKAKPRRNDQNNALRYVLRFVVGWADKDATKRVTRYVGALQPLFDARTDPSTVAEIIRKSGGVEQMYAAARARRTGNPAAKKEQVLRLLPADGEEGERFMRKLAEGRVRANLELVSDARSSVRVVKFKVIKKRGAKK